jgi:hypothetical protein
LILFCHSECSLLHSCIFYIQASSSWSPHKSKLVILYLYSLYLHYFIGLCNLGRCSFRLGC